MSYGVTAMENWLQKMNILKNCSLCLLAILVLSPIVEAAEPIPVTVEPLGNMLVDRELRAPAVVISANRAVLTSQVAALISVVARDVGDQVSKGELLIRLDDANARHALEQTRALLAAINAQIVEAESRVVKAEELLEKNFISDEELIARRSNLAVLEANRQGQQVAVNIAKLDLERTQVNAPFDAAVVSRQAQVGSYAQPGTALITLVQTSDIEIDVELDPRYATHIPKASDVRFSSQGEEWPVDLLRLSNVIDIANRIVHARFRFTGDAAAIGTSGQLIWNESSGLVPVSLIVQRGDQLGIFIAEGDTARFIPIPNAQEGRPAAVDLSSEKLIISRGHPRLQDGDKLQVNRE
jgi:RND family efflux transporter MFP subunit